jgi:hypothetical protein
MMALEMISRNRISARACTMRFAAAASGSAAMRNSLAKAVFFVIFLHRNSDFGGSGRCVPTGRTRFGSSQNPGCGAACSDADVLRELEASLN